jgi:hypothetical protein
VLEERRTRQPLPDTALNGLSGRAASAHARTAPEPLERRR